MIQGVMGFFGFVGSSRPLSAIAALILLVFATRAAWQRVLLVVMALMGAAGRWVFEERWLIDVAYEG